MALPGLMLQITGSAAAMGIIDDHVVVLFLTRRQNRTAEAMMGYMTSLLLMASIGLYPVSNALAWPP